MISGAFNSMGTLVQDIRDLDYCADFVQAKDALAEKIPFIESSATPLSAKAEASLTKITSIFLRIVALIAVVGMIALVVKMSFVAVLCVTIAIAGYDAFLYHEQSTEQLKAEREGKDYKTEIYKAVTTDREKSAKKKEKVSNPFQRSKFTEGQIELMQVDSTYCKLRNTSILGDIYYPVASFFNFKDNPSKADSPPLQALNNLLHTARDEED